MRTYTSPIAEKDRDNAEDLELLYCQQHGLVGEAGGGRGVGGVEGWGEGGGLFRLYIYTYCSLKVIFKRLID